MHVNSVKRLPSPAGGIHETLGLHMHLIKGLGGPSCKGLARSHPQQQACACTARRGVVALATAARTATSDHRVFERVLRYPNGEERRIRYPVEAPRAPDSQASGRAPSVELDEECSGWDILGYSGAAYHEQVGAQQAAGAAGGPARNRQG